MRKNKNEEEIAEELEESVETIRAMIAELQDETA